MAHRQPLNDLEAYRLARLLLVEAYEDTQAERPRPSSASSLPQSSELRRRALSIPTQLIAQASGQPVSPNRLQQSLNALSEAIDQSHERGTIDHDQHELMHAQVEHLAQALGSSQPESHHSERPLATADDDRADTAEECDETHDLTVC